MSSCTELLPAPPCGYHGTCINGSLCVCNKGFSQSIEFSYFTSGDLSSGFCNHNETIIRAICILMMISIVIVLPQTIQVSVHSWKTLKRSLPELIGMVSQFIFGTYRLAYPNSFLGHDVFLTFLYALFTTGTWRGSTRWISKYLRYLSNSFPFAKDARWLAEYSVRINQNLLALDIVMFQLFTVSAFVSEKKHQSLILFRTALGWDLARHVFIAVMIIPTSNLFIKDMKLLLDGQDTVGVGYKAVVSRNQQQLIQSIKIQMPLLKMQLKFVYSYLGIAAFFFGFPLLWNFALQNGFYLLVSIYPIYNFLVILVYVYISKKVKKGTSSVSQGWSTVDNTHTPSSGTSTV